jgi:hypothetical protein
MVLHFDNAIPRGAKCTIDYLRVNRLTRTPHPGFPPDFASKDFYIFGKLRMTLMGSAVADGEQLQDMMEVLDGIPREELEAVFQEWFSDEAGASGKTENMENRGSLISIFSLSQLYPVWPC